MRDKPNDNGAPAEGRNQLLLAPDAKNPHDLLSGMTQTNLPGNVILAAVVTLVAMCLLSAGPYFYNLVVAQVTKATDEVPVPQSAPAPKVEPGRKNRSAEPVQTNPDPLDRLPASTPHASSPPRGSDPLEKLGVSETKTTDPTKNPLEKGTDDLLKDIK